MPDKVLDVAKAFNIEPITDIISMVKGGMDLKKENEKTQVEKIVQYIVSILKTIGKYATKVIDLFLSGNELYKDIVGLLTLLLDMVNLSVEINA